MTEPSLAANVPNLVSKLDDAGYVASKLIHASANSLIFKAQRANTEDVVAVKIYLDSRSSPRSEIEEILPRVNGVMPPPVIDHLHDGTPLAITEFLPMGSLRDSIGKTGARTLADAAMLISKIALALASIHEAGVVHADIKPENILLKDRDSPMIIDLGAAHLSGSPTQPVGTPTFQAPETHRSGHSSASDVYSLGALLYFILTGKNPTPKGLSDEDWLGLSTSLSLTANPTCVQRARTILQHAFHASPGKRPTARQLASELRKLALLCPTVVGGPGAAQGTLPPMEQASTIVSMALL
jgi:serine/threonine protein kinase